MQGTGNEGEPTQQFPAAGKMFHNQAKGITEQWCLLLFDQQDRSLVIFGKSRTDKPCFSRIRLQRGKYKIALWITVGEETD